MRRTLTLYAMFIANFWLLPAAMAGPCEQADLYTGCTAPGGVSIVGTGGHAGNKPDKPAPIGAIEYVACGADTLHVLQALRDPRAVDDVQSCAMWKPDCDAVQKLDGRPRYIAIRVVKQSDGTWSFNGGGCEIAGPPTVTAQLVTQRAIRMIPPATIEFAPKTNTLVNMQTIMWVDAPRRQSLPIARILGKNVRITITLDHVTWTFGDGSTATSSTAGKPYDDSSDSCTTKLCPGYFGHVYAETGRHRVTARASWRATFSVDGARAAHIPGTVDGPSADATINVREARGVLVDNPPN